MTSNVDSDERTLKERISDSRQKLLAFSGLVVLIVLFAAVKPEDFLQVSTLTNILTSTAVNGTLAIAATMIIITGGIDLSIGTLMTFCAVAAGVFITWLGLPMPLGVVGAILTGVVCGGVSGFLIAYAKIPPFITTLGMMLIYKGLSLQITNTKPIYFTQSPEFQQIASGSIIKDIIPGLPIANSALIMAIVAIVIAFVLANTLFGRFIFALGSNEEALRLSGVNVDRWKMMVYAVAGGICAIAGLLIASRGNSAQPAQGMGFELDAIAAVVIGGTSLAGGRGTVLGTMIGAFVMSVVQYGLRLYGMASEKQVMVTGLIIILAVYSDIFWRKKA
ncbi:MULTISPECIES: ABC transporter permease [unclassified Rhizobium]|uniref:ABC transporter permease n=1 Tax=unclassified Rhizobium TaxID=2613769 RepID=UPI00381A8DDB